MTTTLNNTGWTGDSITGLWTEDGDIVNGVVDATGLFSSILVASGTVVNTRGGDDFISGPGSYGILNFGTINTDSGNDSITGSRGQEPDSYGILNFGTIDTGSGNDSITGSREEGNRILNFGTINTGSGDDLITGSGGLYGIDNWGTIDTGNGNDTIIGSGDSTGFNNRGTIDTGNGNDRLIANGGFMGSEVFLGSGDDYLKGFGSGSFDGGNGQDILELTAGAYTVGISGSAVTFISGSTVMRTTGFEQLIAGSAFDFASLSNGQIILVSDLPA